MKFSVITPVLNGAPFLERTIASVRAQSHDRFDHLIIDAGSTDGSLEIAADAARADRRVRLERRPGEPLYASLLYGLEQADGDMLSWLNADDLYVPWALKAVAEFCKRRPGPCWVTGLPACWDEKDVLRYVRLEGWRPQRLIRDGWFHKDLLGFIQQESVFFSRDLFVRLEQQERNRFAASSLAGDFMLWKYFARHAPLETIPTVLGGFRRHGANKSSANMDAYMAEAKAAGARILPGPLRTFSRFLYAGLARRITAKRVAAEDALQAREISAA